MKKIITLFLFYTLPLFLFAKETQDSPHKQISYLTKKFSEEEKYTINFSDVSVIEVLQFISKTAHVNFIYDEKQLQFNVTIVSEEPTSLMNVVSALLQVLRINGFTLLEQGDNIIVHQADDIKQFSQIVSEEHPLEGEEIPPILTRVFHIKNGNIQSIASIFKSMMSPQAMIELSEETRHLIVTDVVGNIEKMEQLLLTLDAPKTPLEIDSYTTKNGEVDTLIALAEQILTPISEGNPVILVPQTETQMIFIISTPFLIEKALTILEDLDSPAIAGAAGKTNYYIYKIQHANEEQIEESLNHLLENLEESPNPDSNLIDAIKSMKWVKESDSLIFTGKEGALNELKDIVPTFDVSPHKSKTALKQTPLNNQFYMYTPKNHDGESIVAWVHEIAENLQKSDLSDPALIKTLTSAKWVPSSKTIMFTGDKDSLDKVRSLLENLDRSKKGTAQKSTLFVYKIEYANQKQIETALRNIAKDAPEGSDLEDVINNMKYIPETHSLVFRGPTAAIERLKELLPLFDSQEQAQKAASSQETYKIYKLRYVKGDVIIKDLENMADSLKSSKVKTDPLLEAIENIRWIKDTNSLLLTGTPSAIERLQLLIGEFDVPRSQGKHIEEATNFFIYKPKYSSPEQVAEQLTNIAEDLEKSGLSDHALLNTIATLRVIEASKSIAFTGTPESIEKVKELLQTVDTDSGTEIKHIGKTTFAIYKLKYVTGQQLIASLHHVASDLQKTGTPDEALIKTLEHMRYVSETDSIIFTGTQGALEKALALAKKFDIKSLAQTEEKPRTLPEGYVVYKPKYMSGVELIQTLKDFEQNLQNSGVQDPELFDVIDNLKWMDRTSSILISGNQSATTKVENLLEKFDVPGAESQEEGGIETIDDVSFLIYKLQYHKGSTIESALKKIAVDLTKAKSQKSNEDLVTSIDSIQWIEVTNSLIGTGNTRTLQKLKDLIRGIDVPLKQVFIEILVLDTDINNTLNFGLRWGSQGKYLDKFGYGTGSFPNFAGTTDPLGDFNTNLHNITATNSPTGSDVPFSNGFDLGIIGDIIMHKGRSYLALGSLVNALRSDTDITIILNQKIITQDNKNSTIFVGSNLPFTGSVVTNTSSNTTQTANLEYRDVGVNLSITPTIGDNDIVTLEIDQEITEEENRNANTTSNTQVTGIATSKTNTKTRVSVPDKNFLVLSGMIRNTKTRSKTAIPCLGGIPILGAAFSQNDILTERRNVIIFVRPHIIKNYDVYKQISERQEEIAREQAVEEDVDEGIELVKTPDDE